MTPERVFAQIADRPGAVWLDSGTAEDGWSILAWDPVEVVTDGADGPALGRRLRRPRAGPAPFAGGVIGFLGYDGGGAEPPVYLARYEGALCWSHRERRWHPTGADAVRRAGERLLADPPPLPPPGPASGRVVSAEDRAAYEGAVRRIQEWIAEGDCYQVNLTRVVRVAGAGEPFAAYRRLRERPARYGAFLRVDERVAVLSNSPELLLDARGGVLRSEPIKGTRPRGADPVADRALAAELLASPKEQAELTMIVDLVRNDLGRVARIGSVRAGERAVYALPTVHHTWWPVTAELAAGRDDWDALAAMFPPGSVTGAPKIRACQRIAELEDAPRGVYCGAIGYAADTGDACWSVAIRVAVFAGDDARYHIGGGIVIDGDPAAEWEETRAKEVALRRALVAP